MTLDLSMPRLERELLSAIREQIPSLKRFGSELASRAEPDFSLQREVSAEDLILPLRMLRFPDEQMFASSSHLFELYRIFSYLVAQYVAEFDDDDPLSGLYASVVELVGIVRQLDGDSAEFSVAARCRVLLWASRSVKSVSAEVVASFATELKQYAIRNHGQYYDSDWLVASLLATAIALTSQLAVKSDLKKELSAFLCRDDWQASLAQKKSDMDCFSEAYAMEYLLAQSGM